MSNLKNRPKPERLTHPSYGMVQFVRTHNGGARRLYGSSLTNHGTTIRLDVRPSQWYHDLHEDRYTVESLTPLIEIELSAAQFSELLTTMNIGYGVPCTIRYVNGAPVEKPPAVDTEVERVKAKFGDDLNEMIEVMYERRKDIEALTDKLPAKSKEKLRIALDVMIQQLESNTPFVMQQFNEASDRVVNAAKKEIEAFTTHALRAAGMERFREVAAGMPESPTSLLATSDEPATEE
jgi:hypothetical protein